LLVLPFERRDRRSMSFRSPTRHWRGFAAFGGVLAFQTLARDQNRGGEEVTHGGLLCVDRVRNRAEGLLQVPAPVDGLLPSEGQRKTPSFRKGQRDEGAVLLCPPCRNASPPFLLVEGVLRRGRAQRLDSISPSAGTAPFRIPFLKHPRKTRLRHSSPARRRYFISSTTST